jgi:hypothetical protein
LRKRWFTGNVVTVAPDLNELESNAVSNSQNMQQDYTSEFSAENIIPEFNEFMHIKETHDPVQQSTDESIALLVHSEFSFDNYPQHIGSIDEEVTYIIDSTSSYMKTISNSELLIVDKRRDDNLYYSSREYIQHNLFMNSDGTVKTFDSSLLLKGYLKPTDYIRDFVRDTRHNTEYICESMELLANLNSTDSSIRETYLVEEFLIRTLPLSVQSFVFRRLLNRSGKPLTSSK